MDGEFPSEFLSRISIPIMVLKDNEIAFANQASEFIGYRTYELVGKRLLNLIPEFEMKKFEVMMNRLEGEGNVSEKIVLRGKDRDFLVELTATKVSGYTTLFLRDVSREESYKKVIRMAIEIERLLPDFDPAIISRILQKYFDAEIIWEKNSKKGDFETPISFQGETFGYLRFRFPSWFVLDDDILELLRALAGDIGESVMMRKYAEAINKALDGLQEASRNFAILVDGIRNPLAVISLYTEYLDGEFEVKVKPQVERILNLVERIEEGWELVEYLEKELRENFEKIS